ncbi:hypothetical protein M426DRAFT_12523 [Hypoxylon sp. CI-4A]|nr:hypothetical protein M426DRAFT_12523 [Hypoxylon sp. CI-4A]
MAKLLKPGGYLQWGEPEIHRWGVRTTNPQKEVIAHNQLMNLTLETRLEDVEDDLRDPPPHQAFMMHQCQLIIHEIITRQTRNEAVRKEVDRLLQLVHKETVAGASFSMTRRTAVGKKPTKT